MTSGAVCKIRFRPNIAGSAKRMANGDNPPTCQVPRGRSYLEVADALFQDLDFNLADTIVH